VVVALLAAGGASILGFVIAGRIAAPLGRLGAAATALAGGDLARRSGIGDRQDEIGAVGRAFDSMAGDLEAADASRRRFFQDAAHELKTPLAVIDATATAVLDGVYVHDDVHLETIRGQSRILAGIVDALRTISLAESGALPMRREPVDAGAVAAGAVRAFAARADLAGITLTGDSGAGLAVTGDPDRVGQILAAFLDNALRHTPPGGTVVVRGEHRRDRIRLSVSDTGPGMPPEVASRVFDRFYQEDEARDRTVGASGLGLAIARALAEALGGSVGVESAEGAGSTFWLELPAAEG
jgi:two-component system, OmpR family, sensor histidine kinase BaeS